MNTLKFNLVTSQLMSLSSDMLVKRAIFDAWRLENKYAQERKKGAQLKRERDKVAVEELRKRRGQKERNPAGVRKHETLGDLRVMHHDIEMQKLQIKDSQGESVSIHNVTKEHIQDMQQKLKSESKYLNKRSRVSQTDLLPHDDAS